MMAKLSKRQGNLIVTAVTVIWGSGFVVSRYCLDNGASAGLIIAVRGALLAVLMFAIAHKKILSASKKDLKIYFLVGSTNALAYILQAVGLMYTSPSACAFLTIMYIVFVPFVTFLFFKRKPAWQTYIAIIVALIGTYILTEMSFSDFKFDLGSLICLLGALSFGISISILGNSGKELPFETTSFFMGVTQLVFSLIYIAFTDRFNFSGLNVTAVILPLLYLGLFGTFIATTAQVMAQKVSDETTVSIIMSLEAVFGTLISVFFGYDEFSLRLLFGGLLIFTGVLFATINFGDLKRRLSRKKDTN